MLTKGITLYTNICNGLAVLLIMTYGEIIAAIQCYIHHTTGKQVSINLPRNVGEIKKMQQMYKVATEYLKM